MASAIDASQILTQMNLIEDDLDVAKSRISELAPTVMRPVHGLPLGKDAQASFKNKVKQGILDWG